MIVTVARGSRFADGALVPARITEQVADLWAGPVMGCYLHHGEPRLDLETGIGSEGLAPVIVPLLLGSGRHLLDVLPSRLGVDALVAGALGPDEIIAGVQVERLREAGVEPGHPVTMVGVGTAEPGGGADLHMAAELLSRAWEGPVRLAAIRGAGLRPADVVRPGDAVSPYLLSRGAVSAEIEQSALAAGAAVVADVLGAHPTLAWLVIDRASNLQGRVRNGFRRPHDG